MGVTIPMNVPCEPPTKSHKKPQKARYQAAFLSLPSIQAGVLEPAADGFWSLEPWGSKYVKIPSLGAKVCKYDLLWATWSLEVRSLPSDAKKLMRPQGRIPINNTVHVNRKGSAWSLYIASTWDLHLIKTSHKTPVVALFDKDPSYPVYDHVTWNFDHGSFRLVLMCSTPHG